MAAQVDTAGPVYAVIGGGIAGVSCAEEVRAVWDTLASYPDPNNLCSSFKGACVN